MLWEQTTVPEIFLRVDHSDGVREYRNSLRSTRATPLSACIVERRGAGLTIVIPIKLERSPDNDGDVIPHSRSPFARAVSTRRFKNDLGFRTPPFSSRLGFFPISILPGFAYCWPAPARLYIPCMGRVRCADCGLFSRSQRLS